MLKAKSSNLDETYPELCSTPDYAASATIFCFQAFPHHFLLEMQALSEVESLRLLAK
jgi:hypothetical protein